VIDTLGHYQLLQVLGQSDVSITYQAWHNGKVVAIKTLNEEWRQNPRAIDMLDYEADTLRSLMHPQLPHFIESFRDGDKPALVMEMMAGENLRDFILRRGPLPLERAIAWILQICEILHYLHSFVPPVVHRDLRPQNLILKQSDGQDLLALVDFGAVKRVILGLPMPPGSKGYTAPEQMDLQPSPPTDLYGLAPLLAFLTTGQNPVVFYNDEGRFQSRMVPRLPQKMMIILNRLTEPDPEARYANVDELIEAFQAVRVEV
jgi:serine/threonine-protein kinase